MKLQMLGTGSAFAKAFFNNNALLHADHKKLMIDCGITAPLALHQLGYTFNDIDALLITHIHGDHVGGVEEFAFQMKFVYKRKPLLYIADALIEPLWEHTLKGGLYQEDTPSLSDYFEVRLLAEGIKTELLPGLHVELLRTKHMPNKISYSMLINEHIFYSSDMIFDAQLLQHLACDRQVQLILHDCQLQAPGVVHASLPELLTLPEHIQRLIYLMHYGDNQPDYIGLTGPMEFLQQQKIYQLDTSSMRLVPYS